MRFVRFEKYSGTLARSHENGWREIERKGGMAKYSCADEQLRKTGHYPVLTLHGCKRAARRWHGERGGCGGGHPSRNDSGEHHAREQRSRHGAAHRRDRARGEGEGRADAHGRGAIGRQDPGGCWWMWKSWVSICCHWRPFVVEMSAFTPQFNSWRFWLCLAGVSANGSRLG